MELTHYSNEELNLETKTNFAHERDYMVNGILCLRENEKRMLFARMGYPDLKSYCVKELHCSESGAWRRIHAMRILREFPEVAEKLRSGALKLCQLNEALRLFKRIKATTELKRQILTEIEYKTLVETQMILAQYGPPEEREDSEEYPVKNGLRLSIFVPNEIVEQWEEFQIYSGRKFSRLELLKVTAKISLDQVKKEAERNHRESQNSSDVTPAKRGEALVRCGFRCEFTFGDGKRCKARHYLEADHIVPRGKGGSGDLSNIQILCWAHNKLRAVDDYGSEKMSTYMSSLR